MIASVYHNKSQHISKCNKQVVVHKVERKEYCERVWHPKRCLQKYKRFFEQPVKQLSYICNILCVYMSIYTYTHVGANEDS